MFGYVFPCKPELKVREWNAYRACYCGLCKVLGREYGFLPRMFLNYDMVFFAMLTDGLRGHEGAQCAQRCIASPAARHPVCAKTPGLALAADALVLSAYYKLMDDLADEGVLRRLGRLLLRPLLRAAHARAARRMPEADAVFAAQTAAQSALEARGSTNPDEAADPTARMTAALFLQAAGASPHRQALERMGLFLGKILYYLDAAEDYRDDIKKGAYNVFALQRLTFEQTVGEVQRLCRMCAGEMALCYNLLEIRAYKPLLDNILFLGVPQSIARAGQKTRRPRRTAHPL